MLEVVRGFTLPAGQNWFRRFVLFSICLGAFSALTVAQGTPSQAGSTKKTNAVGISGTVLDANGDVLPGATVTLSDTSNAAPLTVQSGSDGQFSFSNIAPQQYEITISAQGMRTLTLDKLSIRAGEFRILPPVVLPVSPVSTSMTVSETSRELSEAQVKIAEQQRIGKVLPNFYSSYDWNAPPMLAKQKFQLSGGSILDPVGFLIVAGIAGAEQHQNIFPAYGGGIEGYGKRYGAAFANRTTATLLGRAVYPSIFHQDPRYFYNGKGSALSRTWYAMSRAVIARGDNGRWQPNYSDVLGSFSSAAIATTYYPASDRHASVVIGNGLVGIGANAVSNLIREFVLKNITSHMPQGANGKP